MAIVKPSHETPWDTAQPNNICTGLQGKPRSTANNSSGHHGLWREATGGAIVENFDASLENRAAAISCLASSRVAGSSGAAGERRPEKDYREVSILVYHRGKDS